MIKLDGVEINIDAYQLDPKEGKDEVDVGLEVKVEYNGMVITNNLPYAHALYLMEKLPKDDPLKKIMFDELKTLPREI
ncbi:MAG: hypothetical protein JSV92_00575 [archaeon]|nr:MAG: hypothetical protein JSV92_00575 [archaeon]